MARLLHPLLLASLSLSAVAAAVSCGGSGGAKATGNGGAASGSAATSTSSGSSGSMGGAPSTGSGAGGLSLSTSSGGTGPFNDFPSTPVLDPTAPAGGMPAPSNSPTLFGPAGSGSATGGPCVFEPEPDTLIPNNWVRPRFRWNAGPNQNIFEIRLTTTAEINPLVVYTTNTSWTMPAAMWGGLAQDAQDTPITVTVRGAQLTGMTLAGPPSLSMSQTMTIAPVSAPGSIVYWITSTETSNDPQLKGFGVGDESVVEVLVPGQVQMKTNGGAAVSCIGCHTSTPDGNYAGLTAQGPWGNVLASIESPDAGGPTVGAEPPFMGQGALMTLQSLNPLGIQTYSKAHWSNGDHVMVTPYGESAMWGGSGSQLTWIDLEATTNAMGTSYGTIARGAMDTRDVGAPTWSHDGNTIVYVSTNVEHTGRLDNGIGELWSVPYNNRQGGTATPISGASMNNLENYYPAFSPDDSMLAFCQAPMNTNMYDDPDAEVFVIPSAGGTATRLEANDPPACLGVTSPGVTNSWPKWAPQMTTASNGKTYAWVIFSSKRDPAAGGGHQLYITGVELMGTSVVATHGALYIWNQPETENNHTPAWDYFNIPTPPPTAM